MSKRNAYVLEILIGQIPKGTNVNIVFGKALGVLGHPQPIKPVRNFLHRGAPTISSWLDRVFSHGSGEFIPTCPGSHAFYTAISARLAFDFRGSPEGTFLAPCDFGRIKINC
jgi:hypothetical protein